MARQLKVFSTPAGFVDAVVAAPSQKAALEAWGVHANLFAEGVAGLEQDPVWREKALASPGEVIRKPRGDPAAFLARPSPKPARARSAAAPKRKPAAAPPPPPVDRGPLTRAQAALGEARAAAEHALAGLAERRRALEGEAAQVQAGWEAQEAELDRAVDQARRAFAAAGGKL